MTDESIDTRLGRIEGKLDLLIDRETKTDDRLHAVEKKVWYGSAFSAAFAIFFTRLGLPTH